MLASPQTPRRLLTAADLARLPQTGGRYELIEGEIREYPWGDGLHGMVGASIGSAASVFAEQRNLGRTFLAGTGFLIRRDPDSVLAPDWAFVSRARSAGKPSRGFVRTVPELVLEVQAQVETRTEALAKVRRWLDAGVRVVWDCDPSRKKVRVHRSGAETMMLRADDVLDGLDVLPGFALPLSTVFE